MTTKERLSEDLKDAMRARDDVRKRTIRMAIAAIKNAEIENQSELEESEVIVILHKEVKLRNETIEGAEQAKRDDLIAEANKELAVLEVYLPQPISPEELEAIVTNIIAEVGATSMREIGQVMQAVMPKVRGRADGKDVNQIVRKLLDS